MRFALLLIFLIPTTLVFGEEIETRIVGGTTTTISQQPFIVQVLFDNQFICGGSIISERWILTAAHCTEGYGNQPSRFKVRGGATYLSGTDGVTRQALKVIRASNYNPQTFHMDVAMIKVKGTMKGANIRATKLVESAVPNGAVVRAIGWGYTSENGGVSNQLRSVNLQKMLTAKCRKQYKGRAPITSSMICAAKSGKDSCSGDSGGPLMYKERLSGIVSWGDGCARAGSPGVYTDAMRIKSFINKVRKIY